MEDTPQNEGLIQEMLRDAKNTESSSELSKEPIIHRGDGDLEAPMTVVELRSATRLFLWDTRTYRKVPVLGYMVAQKLQQRRPDGSLQFTAVDPKRLPKRGTIKCMLHQDGEKRAYYNEQGFRVCPKENITNPYQLKQHMVKKHPQEWAAIEEEKKERERQEDRELQRLLIKGAIEKPPVYVSNKDKIKKE